MLEIGCIYSKPELSQMFGTRAMQGLKRKMERYGIVFSIRGQGERANFRIEDMKDPFKVYIGQGQGGQALTVTPIQESADNASIGSNAIMRQSRPPHFHYHFIQMPFG